MKMAEYNSSHCIVRRNFPFTKRMHIILAHASQNWLLGGVKCAQHRTSTYSGLCIVAKKMM